MKARKLLVGPLSWFAVAAATAALAAPAATPLAPPPAQPAGPAVHTPSIKETLTAVSQI